MSRARFATAAFALPLLLACVLEPAAARADADEPGRTVVVPLVHEMPRLDGRLDEALWREAAVVSGFIQTEPRNAEAALQPTEVRLAYTREALLIGARLVDDEASRIVANEYRRDANLEADDAFEVFLDTYRDRRNAFYFATNPVGAQRDGMIRNEGAVLNWEWDGVWDVACSRDEGGWTAELVIPFATLRFRQASADGWGVNFGRLVARTREQSYWSPMDRNWGFDAKWRVSGYATLTGLDEAHPGGRLKLKPYALGGAEHDLAGGSTDADVQHEIGLDAKIAVTSTLAADLTVNTDFAQVESDQEQVNLTRFPLFFPEKREFFLENAGLFNVGELVRFEEPPSTLLFFSRRIGLYQDEHEVPILGGARLTGKLGRFDVGAFDIATGETRVDEDTVVPRTNFAAVRVKRDIFTRSSVGALLLSKSPADEADSNRVVAVDATVAPSASTRFHGFAAKSFTPGLTGSSHAAGVDGSWQSDKGAVTGSYVDIGDDFNSEMGFLQRTGIRKLRVNAMVSPRPRKAGIRQVFFGVDHTYITDRQGRLESQLNSIGPFIMFDNGGFIFGGWQNIAEGLTEPFEIREGVEIPLGTYRFNQGMLQYMGDRSRRVSVNAGAVFGGFFNGRLQSFNVAGRIKPHGRLELSLEYYRNHVKLPIERGDFVTNLVVSRAILAFSPRAYLRGLFQYNDDDGQAAANVLFRYTYHPGADLYVVYNEERDTRSPRWDAKMRELVVKLTFYWATL